MSDTIFALSSGSPPAAIAVIRISGPDAGTALARLTGRQLPKPRFAAMRELLDSDGALLDIALVLWFPAPSSATGEDCAELHCHGGRAVVTAVLAALRALPGLRDAEAGEFTRRAFAHGRLDLAQAEALGDLLVAETQLQRRIAQSGFGGRLSAEVKAWRDEVLALSALVEAALDFAEDDDITEVPAQVGQRAAALASEIDAVLGAPRTERLREGIRVVLAGPPNAGKSSLFNRFLQEDAAIVKDRPGTTRDTIERSVAWDGVPFVLIDTAGLRNAPGDDIEEEGIARAEAQIAKADLVLWLGPEGEGPEGALEVQSRCDDPSAVKKNCSHYRLSALTGEGVPSLIAGLVTLARDMLPSPSGLAVNDRQARLLAIASARLEKFDTDPLISAENLRTARVAFDELLGHSGVEHMLDALFSRFCIGK